MTPLDKLCQIPFHQADDSARTRILSRLADTELFVALVREPADDLIELQGFDLPEGRFALACDREDRLAGFLGTAVAHVAMPGRVLARTLAQAGQGLLVNPGQPSELMLDADVLAWLVKALEARPGMAPAEQARRLTAPSPEAVAILAEPLAQRLGDMAGLVTLAMLVAAEWQDGRHGHALILRGVEPEHEARLAKAMAELLAFLPEIPGGVDIGFSAIEGPNGALLLEPPPPAPEPEPVRRDPSAPPRLR
ncbi:SseB family protein [Paracoccus sp. (in: a-proteobacteria)]|uniref:SseB family protein n=1 Tax=Paracoccus sp. TaxID=267 RepID=UPI0032208D6B